MKRKRRILVAIDIIIGFLVINIIATAIVYSMVFSKGESLSMDTDAGIIDYLEYGYLHERTEVSYDSDGKNLCGYYYSENDTDKLVVVSSGIKESADALLAVDYYFLENGYNVFSYDAKGTGKSEGKVKGFSEGLVDLDYTLKYLESEEEYKKYDIYLFGFSMGGYSSCSVLKYHDDIKAVASVSGYNEARHLVARKGFDYAGPVSWLGAPIVNVMDKANFGSYLNVSASDAIKASSTPVFVARGTKDKVITTKYAISSYVEESDKLFKYEEEASHSGILYSNDARMYQEEVNKELKKEKNKKEYLDTVDDEKYSELNSALFSSVITFYGSF